MLNWICHGCSFSNLPWRVRCLKCEAQWSTKCKTEQPNKNAQQEQNGHQKKSKQRQSRSKTPTRWTYSGWSGSNWSGDKQWTAEQWTSWRNEDVEEVIDVDGSKLYYNKKLQYQQLNSEADKAKDQVLMKEQNAKRAALASLRKALTEDDEEVVNLKAVIDRLEQDRQELRPLPLRMKILEHEQRKSKEMLEQSKIRLKEATDILSNSHATHKAILMKLAKMAKEMDQRKKDYEAEQSKAAATRTARATSSASGSNATSSTGDKADKAEDGMLAQVLQYARVTGDARLLGLLGGQTAARTTGVVDVKEAEERHAEVVKKLQEAHEAELERQLQQQATMLMERLSIKEKMEPSEEKKARAKEGTATPKEDGLNINDLEDVMLTNILGNPSDLTRPRGVDSEDEEVEHLRKKAHVAQNTPLDEDLPMLEDK
eukprot:TRINITY_DN43887_c0_g1_i1.p1 TRINITY_DN43887_c0_g1~~TRINITY_DN43887_c0_g1_i1.p1  ORF type:complete len:429 (-),score=153.08 TRINITY_DN43887_c0_g1_i1:157-1443(-)